MWNLFLNEKKCSTVHYMPRLSTTLNYHLNGQQVPSKAMEKDLGLIVSADFNWRPHYQSITSRAYKVLGLLRRVFSGSVSVSAKCSLYFSGPLPVALLLPCMASISLEGHQVS